MKTLTESTLLMCAILLAICAPGAASAQAGGVIEHESLSPIRSGERIGVTTAFADQPAVDSTRVYFKAPGEDAYGFLLMQRADAQYVAGESPSRSPLSSVTTSIRTWSAPGAGEALPP